MAALLAAVSCHQPSAKDTTASNGHDRNGVLHEVWKGIEGTHVKHLTDSPRYAKPADEVRALDSFEFRNIGDNYGSRSTALLVPPVTGNYTFWLASDDAGQLLLGADDTAARSRLVAEVKTHTAWNQWTKEAGQKSQPVPLEAGQAYFIQVLQKEGIYGDLMRVAWKGPGFRRKIIESKHLRLPSVGDKMQGRIDKTRKADAKQHALSDEAARYWKAGKTLPVKFCSRFPVDRQKPVPNDTGINVLMDQAHQTMFHALWGLRGFIRGQGFRVCTSLASLDCVLEPGRHNRIRLGVGDKEPFAWWPTPEFNVVTTSQQDLKAQYYTPKEREALTRFVENGGGLMVFGGLPADREQADGWSMNHFLRRFGARVTHNTDTSEGATHAALELDKEWEVLARGKQGRTIRARRTFGKGRIAIWEREAPLNPNANEDTPQTSQRKLKTLKQALTWLAEGKPPVGGDWKMPHMGGVGIFPELEQHLGGVVVYYSASQPEKAMRCIEDDIPKAARQILAWLPNKKFDEPYTIVMGAGSRGGWAIGARPRAAAVLAYDPHVILGTFAHEMVHTMGGPRNAKGELAGLSPHHNQGEAHAGWFQGKIAALFNPRIPGSEINLANEPCRDGNSILALEKKKGALLDLTTDFETAAGRKKWGYGQDWTKLWYIYQKLDDRFGPTWYPRWYWVRSTRWQDDPAHRETWTEMVEDMSIAVGEDLFPFFRKIGTTLDKDRLERIEFQGKTLELPVSPLDTGPAGKVRLDPIGDHTKPLARPGT